MSTRYVTESVIRGHHVSKDFFTPSISRILSCEIERGNVHDIYAVAVKDDDTVVGHMPRSITSVCHTFLNRSDTTIDSEITGNRIYSRDLPQGGLEIPCNYIFEGPAGYVDKVKRFINATPGTASSLKTHNYRHNSTTKADMSCKSVSPAVAKSNFNDDQSINLKVLTLALLITKEVPTPCSENIVDADSVDDEEKGMGIGKQTKPSSDDTGKISESLTQRDSVDNASSDNTEANFDYGDEVSSRTKRYTAVKEIDDMPDISDGKPAKISRIDIDAKSIIDSIDDIWLQLDKNNLTMFDKTQLVEGNRLNDHHINYAQCLLKQVDSSLSKN